MGGATAVMDRRRHSCTKQKSPLHFATGRNPTASRILNITKQAVACPLAAFPSTVSLLAAKKIKNTLRLV